MQYQMCDECNKYVVQSDCTTCMSCLMKRDGARGFDLPRPTFTREPAQIRIAGLEKRLRQLDDERDRVAQEIADLKQWGE